MAGADQGQRLAATDVILALMKKHCRPETYSKLMDLCARLRIPDRKRMLMLMARTFEDGAAWHAARVAEALTEKVAAQNETEEKPKEDAS